MSKNDPLDEQYGDLIEQLQSSQPTVPQLSTDDKTAIYADLVARYPVRRRSVRLVPISLTLAAIVIVGLLIWSIVPRPVSAAEIMNRASIAATNTGAFGLTSYTGTMITWYADWSKPETFRPQKQDRIWAQIPGLMRDERYSYLTNLKASASFPDPSTPVTLQNIFVNNGSTAWWYDVAGKSAVEHIATITTLPPVYADLQQLIEKLSRDNSNVVQLGSETVAGRDAYVIGFTQKTNAPKIADDVQVKVWIDKQTYVQLGAEYYDDKGNVGLKWLYSEFSPNVDIPADKFVFNPTPDIVVHDLRTPKDAADVAMAWKTVASSVEYEVFRPTYIPTNLTMERPFYSPSIRYNDAFPHVQQDFYASEQGFAQLSVLEQKNDGSYRYIGSLITVGGYKGSYFESTGQRMLRIIRGETEILLDADQHISKDELFKIAEGMVPVPKS